MQTNLLQSITDITRARDGTSDATQSHHVALLAAPASDAACLASTFLDAFVTPGGLR
jgi:hypothetical protein